MLAASQYSMLRRNSGGALPATITYIGTVSDATNLTTYTFTAANLGTGGGHVALVVIPNDIAAINSVTVDGQSCTAKCSADSGNGRVLVAIYLSDATVAATSGNIVVAGADSGTSCAVHVYRINNLQSTTATDTDTTATDNSAITLTVSAGGVFIGGASNDQSSGTFTWTNITEDYDAIVEVARSSASGSSVGGGNISLTCDATSVTDLKIAYASFR